MASNASSNLPCPRASEFNVKNLTHKEMLEKVESGQLSKDIFVAEVQRRKIRKEQRKMLTVKQDFVISKGKSRQEVAQFSLEVQRTKLSQTIHMKPFTKSLLQDMIAHKSYGPWWREKVFEILYDETIDIGRELDTLAYSTYKSATVEYWEDLMWGSRRKRDKFIDHFNAVRSQVKERPKIDKDMVREIMKGFYGVPDAEQEEIAETQALEEPVLEETSSLAGNANITFLEEREVDSDATHIGQSISAKDPHNNLAESPWTSISEILQREMVIHQGSWESTTKEFFLSIGIPKCAVSRGKGFIRRQLALLAFLRAGYEIRIQFNGNRFAQGSLIFALLPPMFEEDTSNYVSQQLFNFPHIRIDAAVSNVGTLFVPFTHLLSHFPQRQNSLESDSMCTLGRLVGAVINPLVVGEGATNILRFTVYGRFVNPEVHQTTWPIEDFSFSDGVFTQAAEEGLFKKILGGGLTTALGSFLSKMTGGLATGIGTTLAGLIFDYPRDPMPAEPIVNHSVGPVCYGTGVDHSIRLSLSPVSQTETPTELLGSTNGDFDLKVLLKIPSLIDRVPWEAKDDVGALLYSMPVTPVYMPDSRINGQEVRVEYIPTMQAYVSRAFCYWRGTIIIKLQFVKTEYNNGRVLVTYSPHVNSMQLPENDPPNNIDTYSQANAVVVDIEEQKEVEIALPYMSPRPWLRCDAFRTTESFGRAPGDNIEQTWMAESTCGFLTIHVLNTLTSPSNVPQDIQINILMSVGDDFELAYPTTLSPLNITSFGLGQAGAYEEYPFVLDLTPSTLNDVNFENKEWILSAFYEGKRLYNARKIEMPKDATWWYECVPADYLGTTDEETITWAYRTAILKMYKTLNSGETTVQSRFMDLLGRFDQVDAAEMPEAQALEEYTTTRTKAPMQIISTKGQRTCEVAPQTVSENAMNLQTILRRFYCIYTSPPLYHYSGFTMITIPVNPSFTPVSRHAINTNKGSFFGESVPTDQVAWFSKLFTYFRGSLRYKIIYDSAFFDVNVVHVPTECAKFAIVNGVKEVDITRIMSYAGIVATTQTQGAIEVEVPFASPYEQCLIDVHNKYFDLRCQNGTLFFLFRNKMRGSFTDDNPTSFQIYRSTGDDFVMNVPRAPPIVGEPKIVFGSCKDGGKVVTVTNPEANRNLGDDSRKLTMPTSTGIKRITEQGRMQWCIPQVEMRPVSSMAETQALNSGPKPENVWEDFLDALEDADYELHENDVEFEAEELPEAQVFESFKGASKIMGAIDADQVKRIMDNTEKATSDLADSKIKETMLSLNEVTSKLEGVFGKVSSTASELSGITKETVTKYAIVASEVLLCGTFVNQVKNTLVNPSLPNFLTLGIELGLIIGLSVSETLQGLVASVVNWAMNFEILVKLPGTQVLDQATDFVTDNTNVICSVVAVIGTILYAYLFDVFPSLAKIKKVIKDFFADEEEESVTQGFEKDLGFSLRNAHFSVLGLSALEKVYNKIIELVQRFIYWILDQENPEVMMARTAVETRDRVLAVIKELDDLDYEPMFLAALSDPLVHNRFYKLQGEVAELTKLCVTEKVDHKVVQLLQECRRRVGRLIQRIEQESVTCTTRYDPFVVCIHGDYGCGKTAFAKDIQQVYAEVMNLPAWHQLYPKAFDDKYWSKYSHQPIVLWDDFGQSTDADKVAIPQFVLLRGSRPVKVNMSANEDKGRDFTSQGIIMTTNVPYQHYNTVRDNGAFKRRRHVMVGMQMATGWDANRVSALTPEQYETYEHCTFSITHNMQNRVLRANQTKEQILEFVREQMTTWHQKQLEILENTTPDEIPRGVVIVPDADLTAVEEQAERELQEIAQVNRAEQQQAENDAEIDDPEEEFFDFEQAEEQQAAAQVVEPVEDEEEPEIIVLPQEIAETQSLDNEFEDEYWDGTSLMKWMPFGIFKFSDDFADLPFDERFIAEAWMAKTEKINAVFALQSYRKAKARIGRIPSRLYSLAKRTFNTFVQKCKDFWNNHPKFCKLVGIIGLLTSVGAIMHLSHGNTETYESGPSRPQRVKTLAENGYESGPARPNRIKTFAEGSEDPQAIDIARIVKQYTYPIAWDEGAQRKAKMSCIQIGGHLILAPRHFFIHTQEGDFFNLLHRTKPVKIEFQKEKMYQLEDKDWIVYNCGVRLEAGKNLSKFFINEINIGKIQDSKCLLITRDPFDGTITQSSGKCKPVKNYKYKDAHFSDVFAQTGWQHNIDTESGQCGGPLLVLQNSVPSPGKILGVHTAGYKDKASGFAVLITREQLAAAMDHFGPLPGAVPIPKCVNIGLHDKMRIIPDGDFTIVGQMPDKLAPAQPLSSTLEQTPFFEEVVKDFGPPTKAPAKLRQFTSPEGVRISPLKNAIVKYGHMTRPFPARNLKKVRNFLVHYFDQKLVHHTGRRVFTIPEAVNGLPGVEFAEKINFKSSPGWPYQMETNQPGKWHMFDAEGNITNPELARRLEERREAAKNRQRVESIWRDCLKDELRPLEKIEAGKTRLFTIAPLDFTLLVRQMYLDFVMAFYSAQGDIFFSAVGINPESYDWTRLYNYLAEKNHEVVAGDYECYDGKVMPEVIEMVGDVINAWYGGTEEESRIRETLFEEIIHTVQLCENTVYMTHQGNPSGNPLTTVLNTIVNVSLMALTWLEIMPQSSVSEFFTEVHFKGYGDDNEMAVSPKFQEKFHQNSIADALLAHNIVYTSESKSSDAVENFRPLDETSFLKRGFRRDADFGRTFVLPTMSLDTLNSYFYYVRKSPNLEAQLQENQRSALIFAAFHGKEFYNKYLGRWKKYMKSAGLESLQISFEEQVDAFLYNAGVLDCKNLTTRTEKGPMPESMEGFMRITNSKPVRLVSGAIEAPFYCLASFLGILKKEQRTEPEDDRWAVAIPSGEGKSYLCKHYPWLFADHDDLLLPKFSQNKRSLPWSEETAREVDFPKEDRRVLLVHHPNNTKRRLVGSFITPYPSFIRMNCIQRLQLNKPIKLEREERNAMLVQLCSSLEPTLCRNYKRSEFTQYTHGSSCLNRPAEFI